MNSSLSTTVHEYRSLPVEEIVFQFEKDFRAGASPKIDEFLKGNGPDQWHLLVELIHSELELRLRAGEQVRLKEYLTRYPGIAHFPNELAVILETEVRLKMQTDQIPSLGEYESLYPELGKQVRIVFRRVGTAPPELPGYELMEKVGEGGMGVVYRAKQILLNREVAVKLIRQDRISGVTEGDRFRSRFRREAEAVAAISHPHVVQIFDTGEHNGDLYLAMEWIDGPSLQKKLDREGVLAPREAAQLVEKVARAIHAVHLRKIVHRDLKPDNILLSITAGPKVADFGLARATEVADGRTKQGMVIGTPEYMSPEQAALTGEEPTPQMDVYGVGAILYASLTGRPPFPRESILQTLENVRHHAVVSIREMRPDCPPDLETICLRCLEKDPHRRYPGAEALADDLRCWLDGRPIVARPAGWLEKTWKWIRRNRLISTLVALIAVLLISATILSTWQYLLVRSRAADLALANDHLEALILERERLQELTGKITDQSTRLLALEALPKTKQAILSRPVTEYRNEILRELSGAMAELDRIDPDSRSVPLSTRRALANISYLLAEKAMAARNLQQADIHLKEAVRWFVAVIARDPTDQETRNHLANAYFQLGESARKAGKADLTRNYWDQSARVSEKLVADQPQATMYRDNLGRTYYNLAMRAIEDEKPEEARKRLDQAIDTLLPVVKPGQPGAWFLANSYIFRSDQQKKGSSEHLADAVEAVRWATSREDRKGFLEGLAATLDRNTPPATRLILLRGFVLAAGAESAGSKERNSYLDQALDQLRHIPPTSPEYREIREGKEFTLLREYPRFPSLSKITDGKK